MPAKLPGREAASAEQADLQNSQGRHGACGFHRAGRYSLHSPNPRTDPASAGNAVSAHAGDAPPRKHSCRQSASNVYLLEALTKIPHKLIIPYDLSLALAAPEGMEGNAKKYPDFFRRHRAGGRAHAR